VKLDLHRIGSWLAARAENVLALMLAAMFAAFLIQIAFRYLFNFPTGWTHELSVFLWIWMVLWGAAFVITEREEIRFDIIYGAVNARARNAMIVISAVALIALYAISFPAVVDYITFMKVQSTAYLKVRFDLLFSIYILFVIATIVRYLWLAWRAMRGETTDDLDPTKTVSGV
jgi:C4-dicarboxylate transporter, DctQ subunit